MLMHALCVSSVGDVMHSKMLNREFQNEEDMKRAELKFLRECRESVKDGLALCSESSKETMLLRAQLRQIEEEIAEREGVSAEPEYITLLRQAQRQLAEVEQMQAAQAVPPQAGGFDFSDFAQFLARAEETLGQTYDPLLRKIGKYAGLAASLIR